MSLLRFLAYFVLLAAPSFALMPQISAAPPSPPPVVPTERPDTLTLLYVGRPSDVAVVKAAVARVPDCFFHPPVPVTKRPFVSQRQGSPLL